MIDQDKDEYSPEWWVKEVQSAEKELDKLWRDSGDKIVNRYLDVRDDGDAVEAAASSGSRKYNIFWANTQILKSALYATPPKPVVKRLHDDAKDDAARVGALILQRILNFGMAQDNSDMHRAFQHATEDRLIPGMGEVWLRLKTDTEKYSLEAIVDEMSGEILEAAMEGERIVSQEVCTDYVHWRDFCWSPARIWSEVWWVSRRVWMTRSNFIKRFGEDKYKDVKADIMARATSEHGYPKGFEKNRIRVMEIWCKETKKAYWIQEDSKTLLEELEDPLQLRDFFPCPQPLLATHTTNSLVPRPDYVMVQDQYAELDIINDRISILTKALRVVGAYDAKNVALAQMITGSEFAMIPVDNWAMLSEEGGMKGVVDWFPIEQVAIVLDKLITIRPLVIQQIYELTSISDIMRGSTNARETLGAQKLKAQYSSVRLRLTQTDVALFVANTMKIKCEIISNHFDPDQIKKQSAIEFTQSANLAEEGIKFVQELDANEFRIEIGEESLSMADYTAEREMRVEAITAIGQFLSQSAGMAESMPGSMPYIIRMIQWVVASFRSADDIETVLDEAAEQAANNPPQGEQAPPDHTLEVAKIKAESDGQKAQMDSQAKVQIAQSSDQVSIQVAQIKAQVDEANNIRDNETKLKIAGQTTELEIGKAQVDMFQAEKDREQSALDKSEDRKVTAGEDTAATMKQIITPLAEATKNMQEVMKSLSETLSKPRRKIPKRDANGDILYVDEVQGD